MDVQVQAEDHSGEEVSFLTEWNSRDDASRRGVAGIASVALHVAAFLLLASIPASQPAPFRIGGGLEKSMPLVAPPPELTQTAPNREKVGKEFALENLLPKPRIFIPPTARSTVLPPPSPQPLSIPEPPKIETAQAAPQLPPAAGAPVPPPPQIRAQERPRITLENVGTPGGAGTSPDQPRAKPPSASVDEAAREVARGRAGGSSGIAVGDLDLSAGGIGGGINLPPSQGKNASRLELLSDPMGVDFHPYLIQILATVKRNWWAVIPESAKLGRQGRTICQFAINRDGSVPKLVIAVPSGTRALDLAAVAGISASNPFPPLPREFKGDQIRLQFTFLYSVR
jgi:TonB family protein